MIMTPEHDKWKEFVEKLAGKEGCNFRQDEERGVVWNCAGNLEHAFDILSKMEGVDPQGSLSYFRSRGACCDCEILFNIS